ncbi:MAG: cupredoxin family copper-binding protein [Mycobacterium sp.]|uniref:cupredoxin domain-containing protein n=1 Tax=Mycobacterium sp. TaxID=1785 RepID=UPI001EC244A2|nr:cupredoxin family copper-binding protein [Mycobacterium sp.]MBV8789808.1 cupredoxin family copper-binding protein [Mycobacterium sp.]
MDIARVRKHSAAVLAVSVVLAGCSSSRPTATSGTSMPTASESVSAPPAPVSGDQVSIDGFAFVPGTLKIKVGTTVVWTNRDEEPHTVAASDGSFHSPGMGTGATFSHTFSAAGTFDYVCSIHPMMHGSVVVTG